MTSGEETERIYSYNPGGPTGIILTVDCCAASSVSRSDNAVVYVAVFLSVVGLVIIVAVVLFIVFRRHRSWLWLRGNLLCPILPPARHRNGFLMLNGFLF